MFNVRAYGAVGTGDANDSSFIQKALDAAEAAGGGIVRVPDGIYRVDSSLQIGNYTTLDLAPNAIIRRNFSIGGSGGATVRNKNQVVGGNTHITIRGGRIDAIDPSKTGKHLALRGVLHSQVRDLRIGQVYGDWTINLSGSYVTLEGLHIDTSGNSPHEDGIHITGGRFITISNCVVRTGDDCLSFTQDANVLEPIADVTVQNIAVFGSGAACIKMDVSPGATGGIQRVSLANIVGKGGDGAGIPINLRDETNSGKIRDITLSNVKLDCSGNTSHGCSILNANQVDLSRVVIQQAQARSFDITNCTDVTLDSCKVLSPRAAGQSGIYALNSSNVEVRGCLVDGATGDGIKVENGNIARVIDNVIRNIGGVPVNLIACVSTRNEGNT